MSIKEINGVPTRMLDEVFWKNGSLFVRVGEGEKYFVYEVASCPKPDVLPSIDKIPMPKKGDTGNFELIVKRIVPKSTLDTHEEYEQIEKYPSNEEWGQFAWTYTEWNNIERAIRKKFFGQPFYDEKDREEISKHLNQMSMYN